MESLLVISAPSGLPIYSARGLSQSLEPIEQSNQQGRTVNGALVDLSLAQFRKYKSSITCNDMRSPVIGGVWPGQTVTVECVAELNFYTSGGSAERNVVSGSSRTEGPLTYYRPQLVMRVTGFTVQHDEYRAAVSWTLQLEEL